MKGIIFLLIISFSFFGCSPIPKIQRNSITKINNIGTVEDSQKLTFTSEKWWTIYNDPVLNELMDLTLKSNEDLKIAKLNIEKSVQAVTLAKSQGGLSVDIAGNAQREKLAEHALVPPPYNGKIVNIGDLGLQANYEIDIFNKIGALAEEAEYKTQAAELNSKWIELNLSAKTAKLYFYWNYLLKEKAILIEQKTKTAELKKLQQSNYNIGTGLEDDVLRADNQLRAINILLEENALNEQLTLNNLNLLSGNSHTAEIENLLKSSSGNDFNIAVPDSVVSDIIVNRPDVSYYLTMIKAQEKHLESAKASFYPQFSITGQFGFSSVDFNDVFQRSSLIGFIGSSVYLPVFHMGAIRANYKTAGIDLNIFIEEYNNAVLNAYTDVNNELFKTKTAKSALEKSDKNLLNEKSIFMNNKKRFEIGTISRFQYVLSNLEWLNCRLDNEQQHFNFISQQLNLINSFGGTYNLGGENGTN